MNTVTVIGRLTKDPELSQRNGTKVCDLRIASNGNGSDVLYIDVATFNRQAEVCKQHLGKGRLVAVNGRLRYSEWSSKEDGSKRSRHSIAAASVQFLDAKPGESKEAASSAGDEEGQEPVGYES